VTGALLALALGANQAGINIPFPYDAQPVVWADVVKTLRVMDDVARTRRANKDANGWPTEDVELGLWYDPANRHGTYAISFTGQATVTGLDDFAVSGVSYNAGTNTTTAVGTVTNSGGSTARLRLTSTKRLAGDSPGTGITNLKIMRPIAPGSATPHAVSDMFGTHIRDLVQRFNGPVRFMDLTNTNYNQQSTWSERMRPAFSYYTIPRDERALPGDYNVGAPWEDVIRLANYVQRDAWVNVPMKADATYVTKMAQVFKCGSDGTDPWVNAGTSTCAAGTPTYPPLDANLKLYVEYSNEMWNFHRSYVDAQLAVEPGDSPIFFDGNAEAPWFRWVAYQGIKVSNSFRAVFGDAAMMTRVRPIYATQINDGNAALTYVVPMMLGYFNNMQGNYVGSPHPPSYYFYGAGGAPYRYPAGGYTIDTVWESGGMAIGSHYDYNFQTDARPIAVMGLRHIEYEGGPQFFGNDTLARQINADSRIRAKVVAQHQEAAADGVEMIVYYTASGNAPWEFTPSLYDLNTPKMLAVDDILGASQYPITYGPAIPATLDGANISASPNSQSHGGTGSRALNSASAPWTGYLFRAATSLAGSTVTLSKTGTGTATVYVDGAEIGGDGTTFSAGSLSAGLHGVVVRASAGSFTLNTVAMNGTAVEPPPASGTPSTRLRGVRVRGVKAR
jgi:hypothetical protein